MIVSCPNCRKPISSKTSLCPHCGFERGEGSDEEVREFQRRKFRDRLYHLKMASYGVITLFLAAFGWYWWQTVGFEQKSSMGPVLMLTLGTLAYLVIRVMMFMTRREMKKL